MNIFIAPFVNALFGFYYLTGSLGWSIVIVTLIIKLILFPLIFPSLKSAERMRELQPKLKKLQEKYGDDKQKLAVAQMDLYRNEGINPMAGCLPQILQIAVLLVFYAAFSKVVAFASGTGNLAEINSMLVTPFRINDGFKFGMNFLGAELGLSPANIFSKSGIGGMLVPGIMLIGSGITQYLSAKLMMPAPKVTENIAEKTTDKEDDMMAMMRTQSTYFMPAMTLWIGWSFSLGILLYWFINSALTLVQQLVVNQLVKKK